MMQGAPAAWPIPASHPSTLWWKSLAQRGRIAMIATLDQPVCAVTLERLSWFHRTQLGLSLTALRELRNGCIAGELGCALAQTASATVWLQVLAPLAGTVEEDGSHLRLRLWQHAHNRQRETPVVRAGVRDRDGEITKPLLDWILRTEAGGAPKEHQVSTTKQLCGRVEQQVDVALAARMRVRALQAYTQSSPEHPLVDACFRDDETGRKLLRQTLASGLMPDCEEVQVTRSPCCEKVLLEIHMPFLDRAGRKKLFGQLRTAEVSAAPDGAVVITVGEPVRVEKHAQNCTPVIAWAVMQHRKPMETGSSLRFSHTAHINPRQAQWLLEPLTARYGLEVNWRELASLKGTLEARLSLRLDGPIAASWLVQDGEDTRRFLRQMRSTSLAAQLSLRNWIAYLYFCNPERLLDVEDNYAMLVYQSLRPYSGTLLGQYSYDVLEPDTILKALRAARKPLRRRLETMAPMLTQTRPDRARHFRSRRIQRAAECVRRLPRPLAALLTGEKSVIDDLCELALRGGEIRQCIEATERNPANLRRHSDRVEKSLRQRLRRMCMCSAVEDLAQMVVLEATAGLAAARGVECSIEALLELRHRESDWEGATTNSMRVFPSRPTR
ncbi:MAG: hypothetical protein JJE04_03690 [Acidobacteriia bacterium]|nr:hypothetical protein [Terriglobia bacterium]